MPAPDHAYETFVLGDDTDVTVTRVDEQVTDKLDAGVIVGTFVLLVTVT